MPWIPTRLRAKENAVEEIDREDDLCSNHQKRTDAHELIKRQQMAESLVMVGVRVSPRKSDHAEDMHRIKDAVQENERQQEMNFPPRIVHHPPKHLWEPKIDCSKYRHCSAGEQHVMKMRDNEVGVVNKDVDWRRRHKDARKSADNEHRDERKCKEHRCSELDLRAPNRAQPVEYFDRTWQRDEHRGDHERHAEHRAHSRYEHVVAPHDEAQALNA